MCQQCNGLFWHGRPFLYINLCGSVHSDDHATNEQEVMHAPLHAYSWPVHLREWPVAWESAARECSGP